LPPGENRTATSCQGEETGSGKGTPFTNRVIGALHEAVEKSFRLSVETVGHKMRKKQADEPEKLKISGQPAVAERGQRAGGPSTREGKTGEETHMKCN